MRTPDYLKPWGLLLAAVLAVVLWGGLVASPAFDARGSDNKPPIEGIEAECALAIGQSVYEEAWPESFSATLGLLSVEGAAGHIAKITAATRSELHQCFERVYHLGFEAGRNIERQQDQ